MDIDLSLGHAYHKTFKALNINYSEIPNIPVGDTIPYPSPAKSQKGLDFSFSGLHYYTLSHIYPRLLQFSVKWPLREPCFYKTNRQGMEILARSFSTAAEEQVKTKVHKAIKWSKQNSLGIKKFVYNIQAFTGGTAKNIGLRKCVEEVCLEEGWEFCCGNTVDNVEIMRDSALKELRCPSEGLGNFVYGMKNYPLGEYKFIDM